MLLSETMNVFVGYIVREVQTEKERRINRKQSCANLQSQTEGMNLLDIHRVFTIYMDKPVGPQFGRMVRKNLDRRNSSQNRRL